MLHLSGGATPRAVATVCDAHLLFEGSTPIHGASIDSRQVKTGDLFVAIPGERTDGHRYLTSAAQNGAAAVLVERKDIPIDELIALNCSVLYVKSTAKALAQFAAAHKAELSAKTVAVTGSVGKTTTRQYIHSVLSTHFHTHCTAGNFNNELGLPLTLLSQTDAHEASVVELGMGKKGDIAFLSSMASPDIGIITTIGTSHIEHLGSREGIRDAKMEIVEGMKQDGILILNGDEPLLEGQDGAVYVSITRRDVPYYAVNLRHTPDGMMFDAITPKGILDDCQIPTFGAHTVLDAMYAIAVGVLCGLSFAEIRLGLLAFEGVGMRQNIRYQDGVTYVLDYYNASPESIRASLAVTKRLANDRGGRCIAVLGSVLELGPLSADLHRQIGCDAAGIGVDRLFTFGEDAALAAEEAIQKGLPPENVAIFSDISDPCPIAKAVLSSLRNKDCILIKASHGIHMERIADLLLNN